jgi:hypothetical protein
MSPSPTREINFAGRSLAYIREVTQRPIPLAPSAKALVKFIESRADNDRRRPAVAERRTLRRLHPVPRWRSDAAAWRQRPGPDDPAELLRNGDVPDLGAVMRVRDVLAGLADADPESDCRVWSDGMRVITTRYGLPVERDDDLRPLGNLGNFRKVFPEPERPKQVSQARRFDVKPKRWNLPETVYVQSFSGARGLTKVVHYFDHQASTLVLETNKKGVYRRDAIILARTWCGISSDPLSFNDTIGPEMRLCLSCQRMFDEWHTACESCGVITHNDEMHTLGGDRDGENGPEAFPPECNRCHHERERIEAPYRTVMSA